MINIEVLLTLVWLHFIADFVFQSDKVAIGKSKDRFILATHVAIYSFPFLWFGWQFAVANYLLHFITDFCSSRATSYLWQKGERHWFFVVVGLDQAIHITCLFVTYLWLV